MGSIAPEPHQPKKPLGTAVLKATGWITTAWLHMLTGIAENETAQAGTRDTNREDKSKIVTTE